MMVCWKGCDLPYSSLHLYVPTGGVIDIEKYSNEHFYLLVSTLYFVIAHLFNVAYKCSIGLLSKVKLKKATDFFQVKSWHLINQYKQYKLFRLFIIMN